MFKILSLFFIALLGINFSAQADTEQIKQEIDSFTSQHLHLYPLSKSPINLRSGPGTNFKVVQQSYDAMNFVVKNQTYLDNEGKTWYKIAYLIIRQEEDSYSQAEQEMYLRSDLVKADALTQQDLSKIFNSKFNIILDVYARDNNPAFTVASDLTLIQSCFLKENTTTVPAGQSMRLYVNPFLCPDENKKYQVYISIYEDFGDKGLHKLGEISKSDFDSLSFSSNGEAALNWVNDFYQRNGLYKYVEQEP